MIDLLKATQSLTKDIVMLNVWIHSDADTGEPASVDVFDVCGKMNLAWFSEAMEDNDGPELAEQFYEHLGRTEDFAWFFVRMDTENGLGPTECYATVLGIATDFISEGEDNEKI